ncbi:MAG: hypothetical protein V2I97_06595 [Desulfococcaceae bacterium]|nr:hypothetical protein [Desulfococcaceae bacterium]
MNALLPIIGGSKAMDTLGTLLSDFSHRKSMELDIRHMQKEQYAKAGVCALEIADTVIRGMSFRADIRQMRKNLCEHHRQTRKDAREIRRCLTEMGDLLSEEDRSIMIQSYCELFRKTGG